MCGTDLRRLPQKRIPVNSDEFVIYYIHKLFLISLPKRRPNIQFNIYTAQAFSEWCVCVLASVGVQADFNTKRQGGAPV